mmetsp:Transcript_33517/g.79019  ORF Transcript_33517/g.79019 Transcript_33517/m.79019 type:complete len:282 (-) Transcript_33517:2977-3822(-)
MRYENRLISEFGLRSHYASRRFHRIVRASTQNYKSKHNCYNPPTAIMNEIIVLNNNAIAYLHLGNVCDACNIMTEASNLFLQTQDVGRTEKRRRHRDCTISWTKILCRERDPTKATMEVESPTVYPYAPTLIKPCCQKCFSTENSCCTLCEDDSDICPSNVAPILWYNLGLCCQLLGSDLGHNAKEGLFYLTQATRLYEKVYSSCGSENPSHGLSTMKMAVLNNQGGIYFLMGEQEAYSNVMRCLSDTLTSISQSFLCGLWGVFYLNLMVLDVAPRPAAAA